MVLAGSIHVALPIRPFVKRSLKTRLQSRAWRVGLGLMMAIPVVAGWPVLFLPAQAGYAAGDWLKIAIPWWILVGVRGAQMLVAGLTTDT